MPSRTPAAAPVGRTIRGMDADQRRAVRRDQILDAALELFAERGFGNTSIELLCQTAYVSTKSFYQIFASREECFLALYERVVEEYRALINAARTIEHADPDELPTRLIEGFVDLLLADRRKALITYSVSRTVSDTVEQARRRNRSWTADFIEDTWRTSGYSIPQRRITVALVAGIFEVIIDFLTEPDLEDTGGDARRELIDDLIAFHAAIRSGLSAAE